ncbi:MAG: SGNH/GDSL hydrolase family protein [Chloroflexota bacterium]|nr:SGNH/GDSL hydrolase family protein [Chloroflexota bacterium]
MHKNVPLYRRLAVPFILACLLLLAFAPEVGAAAHAKGLALVGPKSRYLSLGNSLAFGFQPDLSFNHGYADDFYNNLKSHGVTSLANMGCPGETSNTFINGGCPYSLLRKYFYVGPQLDAALVYLYLHPGQVSPVTLDIGANDFLGDINKTTCTVSANFNTDLQNLDNNLTQVILPKLHAALTINGQTTGDLVMMNYYDPYQNICPNTVSLVQLVNQHLANDVQGYGTIVDVFSAFGGATTPNPNICTYTWICSIFKDIHAKNAGYSVIAQTFENGTGY